MTERFIHAVRVERPPPSETAIEARERLRDRFPRNAVRRMTHLGMLVGAALDGCPIGRDDSIVYATTHAETRALEDFLTSFPAASPLLFQTSVHPSAVQQVLIGRQQAIRRYWPVTGHRRLVEHALMTAMHDLTERVLLVGGEEKGTWMLANGMASDRAFAFALVLGADRSDTLGSVRLEPANNGADLQPPPPLAAFAESLAARQPVTWRGAGGQWSVAWR